MDNERILGVYPVRFRDLVNEMIRLCDMNSKKDVIGFYITTSVCFYGRYNLEEIITLMNNKDFNFRYGNDYLNIIMYGKKNNTYLFFYNIKLKLNFDELENKGKKLLDFSFVTNGNDYLNNLNYTSIGIDGKVDDLILYFDDSTLNKDNSRDFFPNYLLKEAVYNCYNHKSKSLRKVQN